LNWSSDQVWGCTKNCWDRPFSLSIIACYRCKNIQSYGKLWGHVNIWSKLTLADYVAIYSLRLPCICLWAVVSFCHKTSPNSTVLLVRSLVNSHTQFQWSNISEVRWVGTKERIPATRTASIPARWHYVTRGMYAMWTAFAGCSREWTLCCMLPSDLTSVQWKEVAIEILHSHQDDWLPRRGLSVS
jgi:hypothetical protein